MVGSSLAARLQAEGLEQRQWQVDGVTRTALIYLPPHVAQARPPVASESSQTSSSARAESKSADKPPTAASHPLVFVFHGHGGSARHAARAMHLHQVWTEAICVFPQGLNTPGRLTDPEGKKPGWQHNAGDQGDRDLKFFDAMLETLSREYAVDPQRVFSTGHSNGGGFTYLLWAERGDKLAAVAPSASAAGGRVAERLKPKPALHIAGRNDGLVRFAWQEQTIDALIRLNKCEAEAVSWHAPLQVYRSAQSAPVAVFLHDGAHAYPAAAPQLIAKFFQEYSAIPARTTE